MINDYEIIRLINCKKKYSFILNDANYNNIRLSCIKFVFYELFYKYNLLDLTKLINLYIEQTDMHEKDIHWLRFTAPNLINKLINSLKIEHLNFVTNRSLNVVHKVNNYDINIKIDILSKTNNGAYRGLVFTEYIFDKDIEISPIHNLQYKYLRDAYVSDKYINGQSAKLFVIGYNHYKNRYFFHTIKKNKYNETHSIIIKNALNDLSNNHLFPNIGCLDIKCPYREVCTL